MIPPIDGPSFPTQLPPADNPAPVQVGTREYYQQRLEDFQQRNPGATPPDYYLDYGDKYLERFSSLDSSDLSPAGLAWRDRTIVALQSAIEDLRINDPQRFADLERNPTEFREFAFASHPKAYVDSGLYHLSAQDLSVIALTPDINDVLSQEGIDQTKITIDLLNPGDLPDILGATGEQYLRDAGPFALTPQGLALGLGKQGERLVDRLSEQDWFPSLDKLPTVAVPDIRDLVPDIDLPDDIPGVPFV